MKVVGPLAAVASLCASALALPPDTLHARQGTTAPFASSQTFTSPHGTLSIAVDKGTGVLTSFKYGQQNAAFEYLPADPKRTANGYNHVGDIQLRVRPSGGSAQWSDFSTADVRRSAVASSSSQTCAASSFVCNDVTPAFAFPSSTPLSVSRSWVWTGAEANNEALQVVYRIVNNGDKPLEFGGLAFPLAFSNNWEGASQDVTWDTKVMSDPAINLDHGYVLTNRLTGTGAAVVVSSGSDIKAKAPLESYRILPTTGPLREVTPPSFGFEGIYSWAVHTLGFQALDQQAARSLGVQRGADWNVPTSSTLQPKESRDFSLQFFGTPDGARGVEAALRRRKVATLVGVPGYVIPRASEGKLIVDSDSAVTVDKIEPAGALTLQQSGAKQGTKTVFRVTPGGSTFGRVRVTLRFGDGTSATAHYFVPASVQDTLSAHGKHSFNQQWLDTQQDFFNRTPSVITWDKAANGGQGGQVLDDQRAWVAGLSDEGGAGAYVSASSKELLQPDASEVAKLQRFAEDTLWGHLQHDESEPDLTGATRKSLFYYDQALEGRGVYQPGVTHSGTWDVKEATRLDRTYNYPHPAVVWVTLYRLGRNYAGLLAAQPGSTWQTYLTRAALTLRAMMKHAGLNAYARFGMMEGTFFVELLNDLKREGQTNATYADLHKELEGLMKQRADLWNGERYPYASEFPWDFTGQEEVHAWLDYFNYTAKADQTVETVVAGMSAPPHWAYSGIGRSYWDSLYGGRQPQRIERLQHHYKGSLNALPLLSYFRKNPTEANLWLLRSAFGASTGTLSTVDQSGFASMGMHSNPDALQFDTLTGDGGMSMAGYALSSACYVVNSQSLGGWSAFAGTLSQQGSQITVKPTDAARQRLFIAATGLYVQLDSGRINSVTFAASNPRDVQVTFDQANQYTPNAGIRFAQTAKPQGAPSGYMMQAGFKQERDAYVVPLKQGSTTTIKISAA
ncbi:hypothetical protein IE81DRAFT_30243 [Ceraceosorus guamensis]|uniref:Uncharacterized protein n=1 Tax=Ceraceosorus guamensis TaxID=1522189 RepID=A0A316W9B8_9BASI|nr:hypothetical protein IE81DRAFT_30243 [Ceraceosorus guamensis]PWN44325.1 hypothetical protein IE81DRAFT_30243 [Ceraceosorus guamensis]